MVAATTHLHQYRRKQSAAHTMLVSTRNPYQGYKSRNYTITKRVKAPSLKSQIGVPYNRTAVWDIPLNPAWHYLRSNIETSSRANGNTRESIPTSRHLTRMTRSGILR